MWENLLSFGSSSSQPERHRNSLNPTNIFRHKLKRERVRPAPTNVFMKLKNRNENEIDENRMFEISPVDSRTRLCSFGDVRLHCLLVIFMFWVAPRLDLDEVPLQSIDKETMFTQIANFGFENAFCSCARTISGEGSRLQCRVVTRRRVADDNSCNENKICLSQKNYAKIEINKKHLSTIFWLKIQRRRDIKVEWE